LDAVEKERMAEGGTETKEYLTFMAADSSNYDDSGFFSSQVIGKALENVGLEMAPITHPDLAQAKANPVDEQALICWQLSHWFTIRKGAGGQWWNLNSQNERPERVSDTYLGMLIHELVSRGYTVFVVRGDIPQEVPSPIPMGGGSGGGSRGGMDDELARAIAASMEDSAGVGAGGGGWGGRMETTTSVAAATGAADNPVVMGEEKGEDEDEEAELQRAIAMSLAADNADHGSTGAAAGSTGAAAGEARAADGEGASTPLPTPTNADPAAAAAPPLPPALSAEELRAKRMARFG
jgi:ataxin-3